MNVATMILKIECHRDVTLRPCFLWRKLGDCLSGVLSGSGQVNIPISLFIHSKAIGFYLLYMTFRSCQPRLPISVILGPKKPLLPCFKPSFYLHILCYQMLVLARPPFKIFKYYLLHISRGTMDKTLIRYVRFTSNDFSIIFRPQLSEF